MIKKGIRKHLSNLLQRSAHPQVNKRTTIARLGKVESVSVKGKRLGRLRKKYTKTD